MADTNPVDLNKWLTSDPGEFQRTANALESVAMSLEKVNKALNQQKSELDATIKKASELQFGKDDKELNNLIQGFDKFAKAQKDVQEAQKATAQTSQRVRQEQDAQANSIEALTKEAKEYEKQFKATSDPEALKNFQKTTNQLEKQKKALNDARKEARMYAKDVDVAEGSLEALRRELSQVTRRRNKLEINSEDFDKAQKEARTLTDQIKRLEMASGDARRNVGNYAESLKEAFASTKDFAGGFAGGFGGGGGGGGASGIASGLLGGLGSVPQLAAIAAVTQGVLAIGEAVEEVNKKRILIGDISGSTGAELDRLTSDVLALSDTFELESKEIADAAKSLGAQTGLGFSESLGELEKQLLAAGASSEVVLELIREYPVQFQNAGLSIEETTKVLGAAARQGDFFGDKLADAVKEIGLRLREFTPVVRTALSNAFGEGFAREIEQASKAGEPVIDLFNKIVKRAKEAGLNTQQLQQLTADLGGGAAEDAGGLVRVYDFLNDSLNDSNQQLTALQEKQKTQLETQKEYNAELVRFSKNFEGLGNTLSNFFTGVLTGILSGINDLIEGFGELNEEVKDFFRTIEEREKAFEARRIEFRKGRLDEIKQLNEQEVESEINRLEKLQALDQDDLARLERDLARRREQQEKFGFDNQASIDRIIALIEKEKKALEDNEAFTLRRFEIEALTKRQKELGEITEETTDSTNRQAGADRNAADAAKERAKALEEAVRQAEKDLEIQGRFDEKFLRQQLGDVLNSTGSDPLGFDVEVDETDEAAEALKERNFALKALEGRFRRERLRLIADESKSEAEIARETTDLLKKELDERIDLLEKFDGESEELLEARAKRAEMEREERLEGAQNAEEQAIAIAEFGADVILDISAQRFQKQQEFRRQAFEFQQRQFEREIEAAEGNEFVQNEIRERQEEAEKNFLEDQARREKNQAIFQASLNAALALGKAFVTLDFTGAIGAAAQLAVVIATPIPSFRMGTEDSPEGIAELAEEGPELVESPEGKLSLAEKRGYYYLQKGSKVKTKDKTERLLKENKKIVDHGSIIEEYRNNNIDLSAIVDETREVKMAVKSLRLKISQTNITKGGIEKVMKDKALHQDWIRKNT